MKVKNYVFLTLFLTSFSSLHSWGLLQGKVRSEIAQEHNEYYTQMYLDYNPFYSGPLLAPSAYTVPKGKINVQPYFFWQRNWGIYDRTWHRVRTRSSLQFKFLSVFQLGVTDFLDLNSTIQAVLNRKEDQHHFGYGDTSFLVGLQLLDGIRGKAMPACKLLAGVIFPTGKYDGLLEQRLGIDATGAGSYGTTFSLNFQKNFNYLIKDTSDPKASHPFRIRWNFGYTISSNTHVKGISAYGGDKNTRGTVHVGNNLSSIFAWEYSFNRFWVFATDWQYTFSSKSTFSGKTTEPVGTPESQNWSVAPAIEFNLNSNFAALAGAWFSLGGKNSLGFVSGVFSFTYLF